MERREMEERNGKKLRKNCRMEEGVVWGMNRGRGMNVIRSWKRQKRLWKEG
jgi:hypothetical protein